MTGQEAAVSRTLPPARIDPGALSIVKTLQREGFTAYLVGGCVRDLLLDRAPKDFDIATDATPEELRGVFRRRCRIIGRRFKLAHVRAGATIFEVATFRGVPDDQETAEDDSGFVVRANTYGTPREDAFSRDFTVNGLFYDPVARQIIDYVGGLADVEARQLRTIGDTVQRFREDPVRLLRAVRFAAKLGFDLHDDIVAAASEAAGMLDVCPPPRVAEEVYRLFETGTGRRARAVMRELGILEAVLPELVGRAREDVTAAEADDELDAWLGEVDRQVLVHGGVPRPDLFALVAWPALEPLLPFPPPTRGAWGDAADEAIKPLLKRLIIPVRHRQRLRGVANYLARFQQPPRRRPHVSPHRVGALPAALSVVRLRARLGWATEAELAAYEAWCAHANEVGVWAAPAEPRRDDEPCDGGAGDDAPRTSRSSRTPKPRGRRRSGRKRATQPHPSDEGAAQG